MAPRSNVLSRRADGSTSGPLSSIYIAGIVVVCVIVAAVCVWLGIRLYKKRKNKMNRQSMRNSTIPEGSFNREKPECVYRLCSPNLSSLTTAAFLQQHHG
jgi:hypothetical protein